MNIQQVFVLLMVPVSLRSACDIKRACNPITLSPISPSISAFGVRAATESITMMSIAAERISCSAISRACSPLSGWDINKLFTSTPSFSAYDRSKACSASMIAAIPPCFCASAMAWMANVVLPEDSGPKISITRPFGYPPTPNALSSPIEPEGITATSSTTLSPSFMTLPLPKFFSILSRVS